MVISPNLFHKLDMEKAYDKIESSFILFMLQKFGLNKWVVDLSFQWQKIGFQY